MVEQLIEEVAHSFEATWRERGELAEKVEAFEKQIEDHRQRENLLTQTLLAAEQAASDVKDRARREAEAIVLEAHTEARAITRQAQGDRERLMTEVRRIEGMLRAALGAVEDGLGEGGESPSEQPPALPSPAPSLHALPSVVEKQQLPSPPREEMPGWPRDDTHEFVPPARTEDEPPMAPATEPEHGESTGGEGQSSAPYLGRISAAGSADFDWGE